jgi:Na+-transporting NADH:ubiquinone oxidoreductase subunit F
MDETGKVLVRIDGYDDISASSSDSLLVICEENDVPMESACGGFAGCNSCRVEVIDGSGNLSPLDQVEIPFLDNETQRLGCQALVNGPVSIRLCPGML